MTTTDWIIDLALIAIVLRQVRESRLDRRTFLLPLAIIGWSVSTYAHAIPTGGNDLLLVGAAVTAGAALGVVSGALTRVRAAGGAAYVKAGAAAAVLWVLGTGLRLAFQLYASHGGGGSIERFSERHDITSQATWVDALLFMALAEVVARLGLIGLRARRALAGHAAPEGPRDQGGAPVEVELAQHVVQVGLDRRLAHH